MKSWMCWPCWGVMSVTLSKLSQRNAKRQARDYLVYFITIILAAALIYAFNGLVSSSEVTALSATMAGMPFVIVFASIIVVGIIGWLVSYITRFMLKKRSRELGTYVLLGMENKQVAQLFFRENLIVGGVALLVGILFGGVLFQALRAAVLALFAVPYTFSLSLSLPAVGLTLLYFGLIYLLALRKSRKRIRTMKIHDLIYFDRQNEQASVKSGSRRKWMFTASLISGVIGVLLLISQNVGLAFLGALFVIYFLFGFFLSFSSGVPAFFDKRPGKKYKGTGLLVFRSLAAKLTTMGVTMAVVGLLFTATMMAEGTGLLFGNLFERRAELYTSSDLYVGAPRATGGLDEYLQYIEDNGVPIRDSWQYSVYSDENTTVSDHVAATTPTYIQHYDKDILMRQSDYTALRKMLGYPEAPLPENGYILHCMEYLQDTLRAFERPLTIGGATLNPAGVYTEDFTQYLWSGNGSAFIVVVPDAVAESGEPVTDIYAAMTETPLTMEHYEGLRGLFMKNTGNDNVLAKTAIRDENATLYAMIVFPLFYLALVLTMVAATILTTQILSDTDRYRRQFNLLHKLGMAKKDMEKALLRQFTLFYAMPVIPAVVVSVAFLTSMSGAFDPGIMTGALHQLAVVALAYALFFVIYLIYIIVSYTSLRRSVLPEGTD